MDLLNDIPGSVFWDCWYFMLTSVHLRRPPTPHCSYQGNPFAFPPTAGSPTTHHRQIIFLCFSFNH